MSNCISINSKEFKDLTERSGLHPLQLEARMLEWMDKNDTDKWPSLKEIDIEEKHLEKPIDSENITKETEVQESPIENLTYHPEEKTTIETPIEQTTEDDFDFDPEYERNLMSEGMKVFKSISENKMEEKNNFKNLAFELTYQIGDLQKKLSALNTEKQNSSLQEAHKLSQQIGEVNAKLNHLKERFKAAKIMDNAQDIPKMFLQEGINEVRELVGDNTKHITTEDLNYADRIASFWSKACDFSPSTLGHPLFGTENAPTDVRQEMESKVSEINDLMRLVNKRRREWIKSSVKKELGDGFTEKEIYAAINDISWGGANLYGISDHGNILLDAVYSVMNKANFRGQQEFQQTMENFEKLWKSAEPSLKTINGVKGHVLFQEHNGKLTGDLTSVYTQDYFNEKNEHILEAKQTGNWGKFYDWSRKNEMPIDIRLLYPDETLVNRVGQDKLDYMKESHLKELESLIGKRLLDKMIKRREQELYDYNSAKDFQRLQLSQNENLTELEQTLALNEWDKINSPYYEMDRRTGILNQDGTYGSKDVRDSSGRLVGGSGKLKSVRSIPREVDTDGNKTKWYDEKYKTISKDENLLNLYNYINDTLDYMKHILPSDKSRNINANQLPFLDRGMLKQFGDNLGVGVTRLYSAIQDSFMTKNINDIDFSEADIFTGAAKKGLKVSAFMLSPKEIQKQVELKAATYKAKTGNDANRDDLRQFREEVISESNQNRSFDLEKILPIYLASVLIYKHKSAVSDLVNIYKHTINNDIAQKVTSETGTQLTDMWGRPKNQIGLNHMKESFDYYHNSWLGQPTHLVEGVSDKKSYSVEDKIKLAKLITDQDILAAGLKNNKITKEEYDVSNEKLNFEIEKIGGHLALSKAGDNLLKYVQIKGMGFNPIAGTVNLLQGWLENYIRAADGRFMSSQDLASAYRIVWSAAFDPMGKLDSTKKIINIEKALDIMHTAREELYSSKTNKFTEAAFYINKKTEFINQMSLAGAYFKAILVEDSLGNKSNLYEAFDTNGKIKDGWKLSNEKSNEEFLEDVKLRVDRLVKKSHGNYEDPLMAKESFLGRAMFQFRTWMPELYNSRWGKSEQDHILRKEFKGRWRSFKTLGGTEFNGNVYSALDNSLYTAGQLAKKILFMKTSFDGRMSDTDAANMKANMMEIHFLLGTIAMILMLGAAFTGDDKKDFRINSLINIITRQQADIMMFADPTQFESLSKNFMPLLGILSDVNDVALATKSEIQGKGEYVSGTHKGEDKVWTKVKKAIPLINQFGRLESYNQDQSQLQQRR